MPITHPRRTLQTTTLLLLLINFALTVNANDLMLGDTAMMMNRYYWLLMITSILLLAAIIIIEKRKSPIDVIGLTYDKKTHKLELTVKNNGNHNYCIKSALRLIQPTINPAGNPASENGVPMAAARTASNSRRTFDLLGEDEEPVVIGPNETKTLTYDVILPQEFVNLDANNNVEVHISYGEDLRHAKAVNKADNSVAEDLVGGAQPQTAPQIEIPEGVEDSANQNIFTEEEVNALRESKEEVADTALNLIQDLFDAVKNSPAESVEFHAKNGNAIAGWVNDIVNNGQLAEKIGSIKAENGVQLKNELMRILIDEIESNKHPYLRRVKPGESFKLKEDHNRVITEISHLEDLANAVSSIPDKSIAFHLKYGNDFASWIRDSIGDKLLAEALNEVKGNPQEVRKQMAETISSRIAQLKD